jgi:hypothetical protein
MGYSKTPAAVASLGASMWSCAWAGGPGKGHSSVKYAADAVPTSLHQPQVQATLPRVWIFFTRNSLHLDAVRVLTARRAAVLAAAPSEACLCDVHVRAIFTTECAQCMFGHVNIQRQYQQGASKRRWQHPLLSL